MCIVIFNIDKMSTTIPVLTRCLTYHKELYATVVLDELNTTNPGLLFPGKKILTQMGIVDGGADIFDKSRTEFTWSVHYVYIRINGTKEFCHEYIKGTEQYVYSLFSHELL